MPINYADIIFFAVVAIYLGVKLFSILGKKNEEDSNLESRRAALGTSHILGEKREIAVPQASKHQETVVKNNLDDFKFSSEDAKIGIKEIIEKDQSFLISTFIEGAKIAFEMLLKSFSEGDKKTLKSLLSDDLYPTLEKQIDDLKQKNLVHLKSLVAIESAEIVSSSLNASRARIGLKFLSEQISVTKDTNGNIVEGDPKAIETVEDIWEFERNIRSNNPNWTIISLS